MVLRKPILTNTHTHKSILKFFPRLIFVLIYRRRCFSLAIVQMWSRLRLARPLAARSGLATVTSALATQRLATAGPLAAPARPLSLASLSSKPATMKTGSTAKPSSSAFARITLTRLVSVTSVAAAPARSVSASAALFS